MKNFIIYGLARSGTSNLAAALANGKLNDKVVQEPFLKKTGDVQRFRWLAELQNEFGFFKGCLFGIKRILSCHPIKMLGGGSGYDPIKKKRN